MSTEQVNMSIKATEEIFRQAKEAREKKDYEKALELFKEAAGMKYVPAYVEIGKMLVSCMDRTLWDEDEAVKWVRWGVRAGDPAAMLEYSWMYLLGHGVKPDSRKCFYWTKRAYEARLERGENPGEELRCLAMRYRQGDGVERDVAKAMALQEQSAAMGCVMAMEELGDMYVDGNDMVGKDIPKALEWYKKASAADETNGCVMGAIAKIYEEGEGVERDLDKAAEWYEKITSLLDYRRAEETVDKLIWIYAEEKRDAEKEKYWKARKKKLKPQWDAAKQEEAEWSAKQFFKESLQGAEEGNLLLMGNVARCYQQGHGVEQDGAKAVEWFEKARDWYSIARMYREGDGVEQDLGKAADYYEKMVEAGETTGFKDENLFQLIPKLRSGDAGLTKEAKLDTHEYFMDGEELCRQAEFAHRCEDYRRELALYKQAAKVEHIPAYVKLGQIYCSGYWFPSDYEEGMRWLQKGVDAGDPQAMFELGKLYFSPYIDDSDPQKGFQLLRKSADMNCLEAMDELASMYSGYGREMPKDMKKAAYWREKMAALAGTEAETSEPAINRCASAMHSLGNMYAKGDGVEKDMQKAVDWYEKAFAAGDEFALDKAIEIYTAGNGVEKDEKKVVELYHRMAEAGIDRAMYELAKRYEKGKGVAPDADKAMGWLRKAAEMTRGSIEAREELARFYTEKHYPLQAYYWQRKADSFAVRMTFGFPTRDSFVKIRRDTFDEIRKDSDWLEVARYKAEMMGKPIDMVTLGRAYMHGERGVEKDVEQAAEWYRKAAEAGDAIGLNNLGWCYETGSGVECDLAKAINLYEKAVEMGNRNAMYHLGTLCESGECPALKEKDAMAWYRKAAKHHESRSMVVLGRAAEQNGERKQAIEWYRKALPYYEMDAARALANIIHKGKESGVEAVKQKAKELLSAAKESPSFAMYANIEDFIPDQYSEFLMDNTKNDMTEAQLVTYLEKERKLLHEMAAELEVYIAEEKSAMRKEAMQMIAIYF